MNESLMIIVLESLAFFHLADPEQLDPDSAAEQSDGAAETLGKLSAEEKKEFAAFARRYADEEAAAKGPAERVDFFRSVPENFGLEG